MVCIELRNSCGWAHGASIASKRLVCQAKVVLSGSGSCEALALGAWMWRLKELVDSRGCATVVITNLTHSFCLALLGIYYLKKGWSIINITSW